MPNRSLDDFAGGDDGSDSGDGSAAEPPSEAAAEPGGEEPTERADEPGGEEPTERADEPPAEPTDDDAEEPTLTVEAAVPTYDFSPDGSACAACGETVETRWQDEGVGMVCADCKQW